VCVCVCVCICISDCLEIVMNYLPNTVSAILIHISGAIQSVDWIFIIGEQA